MTGTVNGSKDYTEEIKLHKAEEPWKPSFKLKRSSDTGHATSVEKKLKRNALSILNKITPEKFELLLKQLKKLDISDEQGSDVLISLIYDKAVREPIYSVTYVKMCKFLAPIKIDTASFQAADFHSLFLQKCLKEFEKALQDQSDFAKKVDALAKSVDQEKINQDDMWEEQYKIKQQLLGNVKLLGELFNQGMLPESVMHNCLHTLFCDQDEVLLETLCLLLKTAGKELLKDSTHISELKEIFQKMQNLSDQHLTSTRIRFLIRDVIDLKENNWIPRRREIIPKTIEEIHREAMFEENVHGHAQNNKIAHTNQSDTGK